ncbi:MAG TPA: hypothetical protein VMS74_12435 [Acidimicrobiia bacterium]|nr:hypothetical protein [Acidimicrobiia bacterium]
MKRFVPFLLVIALGSMLAATAATAQEEIPPHPHMLVLGLEFDGEEAIGYRSCVDLAANKTLRLNAHHERMHFGRAGEALFSAGHAVVPGAPAFDLPWSNCEELIAFVFGG